jgi:hypothetical protein
VIKSDKVLTQRVSGSEPARNHEAIFVIGDAKRAPPNEYRSDKWYPMAEVQRFIFLESITERGKATTILVE